MTGLTRRELLTGIWKTATAQSENPRDNPSPEDNNTNIESLLAKSRNRAPWEPKVNHGSSNTHLAVITSENCLQSLGTVCFSCVEHCSVDDAIRPAKTTPIINAEYCTGCGSCMLVCPAPKTAILLRKKPC